MTQVESSVGPAQPGPMSLFDRLVGVLYRTRAIVPLSAGLLILPVAAALADGQVSAVFSSGLWRALYVEPAILIYILLIAPLIQRVQARVAGSLRPVVRLAPEEFDRILAEQARRVRRGELVAVATGAAVGAAISAAMLLDLQLAWVFAYLCAATVAMYAALAWVIYGATSGARMTHALLCQPLDVDILDIRPFEPIGRASLMASTAFVAGATLAMVFAITDDWVFDLPNLIAYAFFGAVAVLVFILNMWDTHRVLARARKAELDLARSRVAQAYQAVKTRALQGQSIQEAMGELNAWISCRERLEQARTWPYDIDMLRKLAISSLLPVGVAAARQLGVAVLDRIRLPF